MRIAFFVGPALALLCHPGHRPTTAQAPADEPEEVVEIKQLGPDSWPVLAGSFSWSTPDELQFSCAGSVDERECRLAESLAKGDIAARVAAARQLWRGHSRPHARAVIDFVTEPPGDDPALVALRGDVEKDCKPATILEHLRGEHFLWGAWLAYLRPNNDFAPHLLAAVANRSDENKLDERPAFILALAQCGDPRAINPLLELTQDDEPWTAGEAALALGNFTDPRIEPRLIELISRDIDFVHFQACGALAKVGTRRAIPALERLANYKGYTGALIIDEPARRAIVAIEKREGLRPADPGQGGWTPGVTLRGHTGYVWQVSFSPDGKTLATASDDRTVRLWDAVTGQNVAIYQGHKRRMSYAVFKPDGTTLVTAGYGPEKSGVQLLDVATGRVERSLFQDEASVDSFLLHPNGRWVAAPAHGRPVRLWDLATAKPVQTFAVASGALAFSADGDTLAVRAGDDSHDVWLCQTATGKPGTVMRGHTNYLHAAAFSPDGKTLVTGGDWTVRWWDVATGRELRRYRGDSGVQSVAFSPDGKLVAAAEYESVRLLDAETGKLLAVLAGGGTLAISPDGQALATSSADRNAVIVWRRRAD